jgi:hypothetical protein
MSTSARNQRWWTAQDCADAWGVKRATWLHYVRYGRAPAHHHCDPETGERVWDPEAVRNYRRPGQGARTDIR